MSERNLYVTFTMDCERIAEHAPEGGGPKSWQVSEEAIRRFAEILTRKGFKGGFYIQPETAKEHSQLFLSLERKGFELGLQFHCGNFRDLSFRKYLGSYSQGEQRHILSLVKADWSAAIGRPPRSFRAGHCSTNDYTYQILYELGFRQSSSCKPARNVPAVYAVWVDAYPYARHVDPNNRLIPGNLELYEIPITVNWAKRRTERGDPLDLRVESPCSLNDHRETIDANIDQMVRLKVPMKTLVAVTHNTEYFLEKWCVLEFMADYVKESARRYGLNLVPATLEEIHLAAHGDTWPETDKGI